MLAKERHGVILRQVIRTGFVTVPDLSRLCAVSTMTIRRDLDRLAEQGLLERTHGGATRRPASGGATVDFVEPAIDIRTAANSAAKAAIAEAATTLIADGQSIALDVGSTCLHLAWQLTDRAVNIFTTSLKIGIFLAGHRPKVYLPGGLISGSEPSLVGPQATEHLKKYRPDTAFIGVSGVSASGFFDYSLEDTDVKHSLIDVSRQVVVLMDSSKFDRMSVAHVCNFEVVDIVISDRAPPAWFDEACKASGTKIIVAHGRTA